MLQLVNLTNRIPVKNVLVTDCMHINFTNVSGINERCFKAILFYLSCLIPSTVPLPYSDWLQIIDDLCYDQRTVIVDGFSFMWNIL